MWNDRLNSISYFADDAQILQGIKDVEDAHMLQNDLHELYIWTDTN